MSRCGVTLLYLPMGLIKVKLSVENHNIRYIHMAMYVDRDYFVKGVNGSY